MSPDRVSRLRMPSNDRLQAPGGGRLVVEWRPRSPAEGYAERWVDGQETYTREQP